jgi:hypothetical protein
MINILIFSIGFWMECQDFEGVLLRHMRNICYMVLNKLKKHTILYNYLQYYHYYIKMYLFNLLIIFLIII